MRITLLFGFSLFCMAAAGQDPAANQIEHYRDGEKQEVYYLQQGDESADTRRQQSKKYQQTSGQQHSEKFRQSSKRSAGSSRAMDGIEPKSHRQPAFNTKNATEQQSAADALSIISSTVEARIEQVRQKIRDGKIAVVDSETGVGTKNNAVVDAVHARAQRNQLNSTLQGHVDTVNNSSLKVVGNDAARKTVVNPQRSVITPEAQQTLKMLTRISQQSVIELVDQLEAHKNNN
ncbi:MAG: hypothetical protein KUG79_18490 [Pseudomonadales bacterium]|nr:hypothetical protein [Pseudomonadales bacterium]